MKRIFKTFYVIYAQLLYLFCISAIEGLKSYIFLKN